MAVHPAEVGREEGGFLAPGAGGGFDDGCAGAGSGADASGSPDRGVFPRPRGGDVLLAMRAISNRPASLSKRPVFDQVGDGLEVGLAVRDGVPERAYSCLDPARLGISKTLGLLRAASTSAKRQENRSMCGRSPGKTKNEGANFEPGSR